MTREQQGTGKDLERSMGRWLVSNGWKPSGRRWVHPRLPQDQVFTTHDAYMQTRAEPRLGWP